MTSAPVAEPAGLDLGSRLARTPAPAAIVIFGASGDLTHRKLMPALYSLATQQLLPPETAIVGMARRDMDDDAFRERMREGVERQGGPVDPEVWDGFARRLSYVPGSFTEAEPFARLGERLAQLDAERGTRGNRLFYLATAPEHFPVIAERLGGAGLADEGEGSEPFARLIVEKPFGSDLADARDLNARLRTVFRERQVYRIDHYLGKETVQNLLVLRFGNAIFEPVWNRRYVDHVQITVAESIGVGSRGGYYERSGALRDIVQNHLLQLLSLVAMEPPARFDSREVRDEKVKVLNAIRPFTPQSAAADTVRARYGPGFVAGEGVPGYLQEQGVAPDSRTETYVALRLDIDNWRWAGTPFYLRTGKRLPHRASEIAITFKPAPHLPFARADVGALEPNVLSLRIQPDEGTSLRFVSKVPGPRMDMRVVSMDFAYGRSFLRAVPDAYERLLLDCLLGDSTLFARWDEVERAWEIFDPLLRAWADDVTPLAEHPAGEWGPREADDLIALDGREWRRL